MPHAMKTTAGVVLFVVALIGVLSPQSARLLAQADVIDDPEAYAVYAAVVPSMFRPRDKPLSKVALLQETRTVTDTDSGCERPLSPEWQPVVESYRKENSRVRMLQPSFDMGVPYALITVAELKASMERAGYDFSNLPMSNGLGSEVFERFPSNTLFTVSAVGFNADKTRAMVILQQNCFPSSSAQLPNQMCHQGSQLLTEKRDGRWVPVRSECGWIA